MFPFLAYGGGDKIVDEDEYHSLSRKHPKQDTGERRWLGQYNTLTVSIWNLSLSLQVNKICWWNLCFSFIHIFPMGRAQIIFQMSKTRSCLTYSPSTVMQPSQQCDSRKYTLWFPICHTLASSNLSLKWTKHRFPSAQRPISQLVWWPFALWLLLNEVSKICIVLGRKHLKLLSKECLVLPYHYTTV